MTMPEQIDNNQRSERIQESDEQIEIQVRKDLPPKALTATYQTIQNVLKRYRYKGTFPPVLVVEDEEFRNLIASDSNATLLKHDIPTIATGSFLSGYNVIIFPKITSKFIDPKKDSDPDVLKKIRELNQEILRNPQLIGTGVLIEETLHGITTIRTGDTARMGFYTYTINPNDLLAEKFNGNVYSGNIRVKNGRIHVPEFDPNEQKSNILLTEHTTKLLSLLLLQELSPQLSTYKSVVFSCGTENNLDVYIYNIDKNSIMQLFTALQNGNPSLLNEITIQNTQGSKTSNLLRLLSNESVTIHLFSGNMLFSYL